MRWHNFTNFTTFRFSLPYSRRLLARLLEVIEDRSSQEINLRPKRRNKCISIMIMCLSLAWLKPLVSSMISPPCSSSLAVFITCGSHFFTFQFFFDIFLEIAGSVSSVQYRPGQAIHAHVPLSQSSIIWYWCKPGRGGGGGSKQTHCVTHWPVSVVLQHWLVLGWGPQNRSTGLTLPFLPSIIVRI